MRLELQVIFRISNRIRVSSHLASGLLLLTGLIFTASSCVQGGQRGREQKPAITTHTNPSLPGPLPQPTGHVNDHANALDDGMRAQLEQALTELKVRAQIEFAIAIVNTTGGRPIFDYSLAVMRGWNVGAGGDGILLTIAIDDRQWCVQTSRKLERDLSNEKVKGAAEVMKAPFGEGHYGEGIRRGVVALIKILAAKRGFAPISIPEPLLRGN